MNEATFADRIAVQPPPSRRRGRWLLIAIVLILAGALVTGRLALPSLLRDAINRRLEAIPGYTGHVDDISVMLWHGGYTMHNLVIEERAHKAGIPFLRIEELDFSIAYKELLHRKFVSQIYIDNGAFNFVQHQTDEANKGDHGLRWKSVINDLFPIDITNLDIQNSRLRFDDSSHNPPVLLEVDHFALQAIGLRNRPELEHEVLPAKITASGRTTGIGGLQCFVELEPLASQPHFNLKMQATDMSLPAFNPFLKAYLGVDVDAGAMDTYLEMVAAGGKYHGYVKPILRSLRFGSASDPSETSGRSLKDALVGKVASLLKNPENNQVATIVPIYGDFSQNKIDFWPTLRNLLHNAFIEALRKGFEGTPNAKGPVADRAPEASPLSESKPVPQDSTSPPGH